jgi:hypothetical protein
VTNVILVDAEIIFPEDTANIVINFIISPAWKGSRHKTEIIM